jgi:dTDP-4-dehydrorhamnose reductase
MTKQKILVTGASGLIGGIIVENLGDKYELSALNRRPVEGIPYTQGDISDLDSILPAFEGIDMVVHMANYIDDVFDWEKHLSAGIIGTRNVFEAARIHGVKRVVYGSTGDTQTGYEYDKSLPYGLIGAGKYDELPETWPMITHLDPVRPKSIYGACKVFGEALGRYYADVFDISILCIRLGAVSPANRPTQRRQMMSYLSHRDCVQVVEKCIEAPSSLKFGIFRATSNSKYGWIDTQHTREVLGWEPQDSADDFEIDDEGGWHQVYTAQMDRAALGIEEENV